MVRLRTLWADVAIGAIRIFFRYLALLGLATVRVARTTVVAFAVLSAKPAMGQKDPRGLSTLSAFLNAEVRSPTSAV